MTVTAFAAPAPEPTPGDRTDGIYGLPVVGTHAQRVREFYDGMEPQPEDSLGVTVGKNVIRYGTVAAAGIGGAAAAAVICL